MCAAIFTVVGLIANLVGVLLLFYFGMPFRIPGDYYSPSNRPEAEEKKDTRYKWWGYAGLMLVILGTLAQIVGAVMPSP
jgi:hypothetical protein